MIEITHKETKTQARCGKIETKKGIIETPAFVLKTNNLKVNNLEKEDLTQTKSQILKTDAFELWKILSDEGINFSTGIYDILKWNGSVITDSGSEKILKLKTGDQKNNIVEITNSGLKFKDAKKGIEDYFDSEISLKIQEELYSDLIIAFDLPYNDEGYEGAKINLEISNNWQIRFLEAKTSNQIILGVVSGGIFKDLINLSTKFLNKLNFDGFVLGNWIKRPEFKNVLEIIKISTLNFSESKIRYIKDIETIKELFDVIELGIDLFDSNIPYHNTKNNIALTYSSGQINLNDSVYSNDNSLLDEFCECPICQEGETKKNMYWNLKLKNKKAEKSLLIHNIYFINKLLKDIREAIKHNKLEELKKSLLF